MSRFGGYEEDAFVAELYDLVPAYAGRPDVGFYLDLARSAGGKVLELGCGTGRVLAPMASAGFDVVGLDLSSYMLAKCREKLSRQPEEAQRRARLVQGNMTDFDLGETFGLAAIPFRAFQHLPSIEEQMGCLRCVRRCLSSTGRLVLDLFHVNPRAMHDVRYMDESEDFSDVDLPDGGKLRRTHRVTAFHRAEQYNDVEMIYYVTRPDGRTERLVQAFPFRYFLRYEVEHLLARCGFRAVEIFGNYDRSPFADDSPEMIFVAELAPTSCPTR